MDSEEIQIPATAPGSRPEVRCQSMDGGAYVHHDWISCAIGAEETGQVISQCNDPLEKVSFSVSRSTFHKGGEKQLTRIPPSPDAPKALPTFSVQYPIRHARQDLFFLAVTGPFCLVGHYDLMAVAPIPFGDLMPPIAEKVLRMLLPVGMH